MTLTGDMLIGGQTIAGNRDAIHAINPATDEVLAPGYAGGGREQVEQACPGLGGVRPLSRDGSGGPRPLS